MIKVKGKYNEAVCYCNEIDDKALEQIKRLCDFSVFSSAKIRIMPDVHAGVGCTIGTTMTITDRVVPGMVGVDIGCGIETVKLKETEIDLEKLDYIVKQNIPCGRDIRDTPHDAFKRIDLTKLHCLPFIDFDRAKHSVGTLGGGNHFIEVGRDSNDYIYLMVHSGSRHLGNEVARYYQEEGYKALCGVTNYQIDELIKGLKSQGRKKEIQEAIIKAKNNKIVNDLPTDLAYVEGRLFTSYINDMKIVQEYATINRQSIVDVILRKMKLSPINTFNTIHNYLDTDSMILRKGAVRALKDEVLLIPMNMRDGSLLCIGKGNEDWNYSAPHGAGRLLSRTVATNSLSLTEFKEQMKGVYSSTISLKTLDEAPMAYKPMASILEQIVATVDVVDIIKPIYNFKATE